MRHDCGAGIVAGPMPPPPAPRRASRGRPPALAHVDFRRYLAARFVVALATQMLVVAVGFQVYDVTRNPLDLGLVGLSQFLPFVLLILPAGHLADAYDRRRMLALTTTVLVASPPGWRSSRPAACATRRRSWG